MDLFEIASRKKYRYPYKGTIATEDLWDLSVEELDRIYKWLNGESKKSQEESLLTERSSIDQDLSNKIEIIKHIVKVKQEEKKAAESAVEKKLRKQHLMEVLARKEDQALEASSVEELKKMLEELD